MEKSYLGKLPSPHEPWQQIAKITDPTDKTQWLMFRKPQAHTPDWATYKLVANGRAKHKANYWLVRNSKTGQIGFAKDMAIMQKNRPHLHSQVEEILEQVSEH